MLHQVKGGVFELTLVQPSIVLVLLSFILVLHLLSFILVLHPCSISLVLSLLSYLCCPSLLSYLSCSFSLVLSLLFFPFIYIRLGCNGLFPQLLTLHSRSVVFSLNDIASYIAFQSQLLASRNLAIQVPSSTGYGPCTL